MKNMRKVFSYFRENNEIYFDNASTTQKPDPVIEEVTKYLRKSSNVGRGSYDLANKTSKQVEEVREKVARFIGADKKEVVFTSGATESLNLIQHIVSEQVEDGDNILVSKEAHKATKLPWKKLSSELEKQGKELEIREYKVLRTGDADIEDIVSKVDEKTKLVSLTHIHNAYGGRTEVERLNKELNEDPLLCLDVCQSIAHVPVDVENLNVDFLAFSGHKMFASTGVGVAYISQLHHENIPKYRVGGGLKTEEMPHKLERGTPNISGIMSLGAATDYINKLGIENIQERNLELTKYLIRELKKLDIEFDKGPAFSSCSDVGYGIVSFKLSNISAKDVGFILDNNGIYVRDGKHCRTQGDNSVRVSMQFYNTKEEIDKLIEVLKEFV